MSLAWFYLIVAGIFEVCWAVGLKYSQSFTKPIPSIFTIITLAISMYLLAKSLDSIPIGTAYAVWVGIGAFGAALLGIVLFEESVSVLRIIFLSTLVISIIGLKYSAS